MQDHAGWGVVIGRFQTPYLHQGHLALLEAVAQKHADVIVLLGVRPAAANSNNPLSFVTRKIMVEDQYPDSVVLPVTDTREDRAWSRSVDAIVRTVVGAGPATLYSGRDGFADHYTGTFETVQLTLPREDVSATALRDHVAAQHDHPAFRAGVIHAVQNAGPRLDMAVDMAVLNPDGDSVIMGKKSGESLWRFPGGMFEAAIDDTFETCASREMHEETGIIVERATWEYVASLNVDDWRCRDTDQHHYHTIFYTALLPWSGQILAGDDLVKAGLLALTVDPEKSIVSEHRPLWAALLNHLSPASQPQGD